MNRQATQERKTKRSSIALRLNPWAATSAFAGLAIALSVGGPFGLQVAAAGGLDEEVASTVKSGSHIANAGVQAGVPACSSCHGQFGEGRAAGAIPGLAGIDRLYLERELLAFRNGVRTSPVMTPFVRALTLEQIHAVAQYYASLPRVSEVNLVSAPADGGRQLAHLGRPQRGLPSCESCHGEHGEGDGPSPALAGQPRGYLEQQLKAWRAGGRRDGSDFDFFMSLVSNKLSDRDIDELSAYYAALPAREPAPAAPKPPAAGGSPP